MFGGTGMLHKCFIWAVYCEPALRTQVWLAICMMGVAVVPTGMLTSRKAWVWGTETGAFCAICMENEAESKLFLHAYCYANGSDSSVSVSISLLVMTTSLSTNYVWNMAQR